MQSTTFQYKEIGSLNHYLIKQQTNSLFLFCPYNFDFNIDTAHSNAFQQVIHESLQVISQKVHAKFERFVQTLEAAGVDVHVFEDTKELENRMLFFQTTRFLVMKTVRLFCVRCE